MTSSERFQKSMNYEEVDRAVYWEMWYFPETLDRWYNEGLPRDIDLEEYFGVDCRVHPSGDYWFEPLIPPFKEKVIEEDENTITLYNDEGILMKRPKKSPGMPQFIKFPLETREDFEELKKRLDVNNPVRYPSPWEDEVQKHKGHDYILRFFLTGLFGWIRNWMGFENLLIKFYDDPKLIHDIMEFLTDFTIERSRKVVCDLEIDYAWFGEDMAYKTGPMISPYMFREFLLPRYKRIVNFLNDNGIDLIFVDCDGQPGPLIDLWLEAGVNGLYPNEVAAGNNPVELRKKYGHDLRLIGGIDKRELAKGPEAIKKELLSKLPFLFDDGGYISWCDHVVPPDVSLENYMYYLNLMKEISLNPKKFL